MRKLITSRKRNRSCFICKKAIEKGEKYSKKSFSVGNPSQPDKIVNHPTLGMAVEVQGYRYNKSMCEKCTVNETAFKTVKIVNSNKEIKK
jgi:hypothetical protein|tara:strand:+ start:1070 stop:1339 length:270 start_codon:yes stop_codon:yes gene_type:complete